MTLESKEENTAGSMKKNLCSCLLFLFFFTFLNTCSSTGSTKTKSQRLPDTLADSTAGGQGEQTGHITPPPDWMSKAVIYEITPAYFVRYGAFTDITAKLPELKKLGINTIWLQPITKTANGGQAYDVTDYFSVNSQLGTEQDLHHLISTAKDLGLRVIFDMVLNHTSMNHPYIQDIIKNGAASPYYDYYQHKMDTKPYSEFYNRNEQGFIYYFWNGLVNLNYKNDKVQRWMLNACKYWAKNFDIDGYRFDSIWGVNARSPGFGQQLRTELKEINPDFLMLAEDKGSSSKVFKKGYDAAYDWTSDPDWVSHWSWEYDFSSDPQKERTIFNYPDADQRGEMLNHALFDEGNNPSRLLRFIDNNDLPYFIGSHSVKQTKMAAALFFAIPGIPMIYNGQTRGIKGELYSGKPIFKRNKTIKATSQYGLFDHYQKLIKLHKKYPALYAGKMGELSVFPEGGVSAFHRWKGDQNFIIIVNMDSNKVDATIELPFTSSSDKNDVLQDILSDDTFTINQNFSETNIPMEGYSVRWILIKSK